MALDSKIFSTYIEALNNSEYEYFQKRDFIRILFSIGVMNDEQVRIFSKSMEINQNITSVDIYENDLSCLGAFENIKKNLEKNKNITGLYFRCSDIFKDEVLFRELIDLIETNKNIIELNFYKSSINSKKLQLLANSLKNALNITKLSFYKTYIGSNGIKVLAEVFESNINLTTIDLGGNNIGLEEIKVLVKAFKGKRNLKELSLAGNNLDYKCVEELAIFLEKDEGITDIDLAHNNIGKKGVKVLKEFLQGNKGLTGLDLGYNHIKSEGATLLLELLKDNDSLEYLDLSGNKIGNDRDELLVSFLKEKQNITDFCLEDNKISECALINVNYLLSENKKTAEVKSHFSLPPNSQSNQDGKIEEALLNDVRVSIYSKYTDKFNELLSSSKTQQEKIQKFQSICDEMNEFLEGSPVLNEDSQVVLNCIKDEYLKELNNKDKGEEEVATPSLSLSSSSSDRFASNEKLEEKNTCDEYWF